MRTSRPYRLSMLPVIACLYVFLSCTSTPQIAGSSGAGNPGGTTTVALVVDTLSSAGLAKTSAAPSPTGTTGGTQQSTIASPFSSVQTTAAGRGPFPIADQGGMPMTVTGATITAKAICFVLESGQDPVKLLERFNQPLQQDSSSIILNGPFLFDAMTGVSVPPIDTLRLPEARYTGIKLLLDTSLRSGQPGGPQGSSVDITGTFIYQNTQRNFTFRLNINQALPYLNTQSVILVQRNDTTKLSIVFNPKQWLSGVNITSCLNIGYITLESSGDLIIDGNTGRGPCQSIEGNIRQNVISSGALYAR
jgi:hypothetical protein